MSKLPRIVVQTIASSLEFQDRLNLALGCREWYKWIAYSCLYHSLSFQASSSSLKTALQFLNVRSLLGSQVRSFSMTQCHLPDQLSNLITRVLPNLHSLVWIESDKYGRSLPQWINLSISFRYYRWAQLQYLVMDATTFHTFRILDLGAPMNQLSTLVIYFNDIPRKQELTQTLASKLRHAGSLKKLVLESTLVDLSCMELIHANTINLKELVLENVELSMDPLYQLLNKEIIYAKALKKLHLHIINDKSLMDLDQEKKQDIRQWLNYFKYKYRNVKDLVLTTEFDHPTPSSLTSCLVDLIDGMQQITHYTIQFCLIHPPILQAIQSLSFLTSLSIWINHEQIQTLASYQKYLQRHLESLAIVIQDLLPLDPLTCLIDFIMNLPRLQSLSIKDIAIKIQNIPLVLRLNQHPTLSFIYLDHGTMRNMAIQLTVRKYMDGIQMLTIDLSDYTLGDHSSVNKALQLILNKGPLSFQHIQIQGDVICGKGTLIIPLKKAQKLHTLEIRLDMIGHFHILKTTEYTAWNKRTGKSLNVTEMKKKSLMEGWVLPRQWTFGELTCLVFQI